MRSCSAFSISMHAVFEPTVPYKCSGSFAKKLWRVSSLRRSSIEICATAADILDCICAAERGAGTEPRTPQKRIFILKKVNHLYGFVKRLKRLRSVYSLGREGFEPSKAEPTDLQSAPFDRSGTSPLPYAPCVPYLIGYAC